MDREAVWLTGRRARRLRAEGIVEHGQSGDSLVLNRVSKKAVVNVGDEIITAGGLHGEVVSMGGEVVRVEIAPDVVVRR